MAEQNPFIGKSESELKMLEAQLEQAKDAANGKRDVAAAVAFKAAYDWLQSRGKIGPGMGDLNVKAFPREKQIGTKAGFSETEIANIRASVEKALG